jgi:hypothetical protein
MKILHKLPKGEHVLGVTNDCFEKDKPCAAYQAGKQVGTSHHPNNLMTASRPLELLHMDLFGLVSYLRIGEVSMVLLLLMALHASLGYFSCRIKVKPKALSSNF